jgi:hypothetical protein
MRFMSDNNASNGTSNITGVLSEADATYIRSLQPMEVEIAFGPGNEDCYIPSKGYEDPEWYWRTPGGGVVGVGWRHGFARLRGNRAGAGAAEAFIKFLKDRV